MEEELFSKSDLVSPAGQSILTRKPNTRPVRFPNEPYQEVELKQFETTNPLTSLGRQFSQKTIEPI